MNRQPKTTAGEVRIANGVSRHYAATLIDGTKVYYTYPGEQGQLVHARMSLRTWRGLTLSAQRHA
jgi:transposase